MYEVIIIGAGTAGKACQSIVSKFTNNYLVIDQKESPSSSCTSVACMPTKSLIAQANAYKSFQNFFEAPKASKNLQLSSALSRAVRLSTYFSDHELSSNAEWMKTHLKVGQAKFCSQNKILLNSQQFEARYFILATGTQPVKLKQLENLSNVYNNENLWVGSPAGATWAVVGSGIQGIEFATAFSNLGLEVKLVSMEKRFGPITDPQINEYIHSKLKGQMNIHIGGLSVELKDPLRLSVNGRSFEVDNVLSCVGRCSNLGSVHLEAISSGLDASGKIIGLDPSNCRIGNTQVYVCGDASANGGNIPEANLQAKIVCSQIYNEYPNPIIPRFKQIVCFSSPQSAVVGKSFADLKKENVNFEILSASFENQGRARLENETVGLIHLYKKNNAFLGAEMFGPSIEHLSHLLTWTANLEPNIKIWKTLPIYHPVLEQVLNQIFRKI